MAKKLTRSNYDAIRDHLFSRIHTTGEQVKNDFPNILRRAIESEAWTHFVNGDGKPFTNLVDWLHCTFPSGPGLGQGRHAITYEEALKLTEGAADVHRVLAENAPKRKGGRKSKDETIGASTPQFKRHKGQGHSTTAVLQARLAQDKPKFYDAYLDGKYKTITAAATAAGILKDDVNLRRAKSAYRKMTAKERAEFLKWTKTDAADGG